MAAKDVKLRYAAGSNTFNTIPSPGAELSVEGEQIDDTVLGQSWRSSWTGLIGWTLSATAYYKQIAGYKATIKRNGAAMAAQNFELTMNAEAVDVSDLPGVQANDGYRLFDYGLRSAELTVSGFEKGLGYLTNLQDRDVVTISISPDGGDLNIAQGNFSFISNNLSGDAGNPEQEELSFALYVAPGDAAPFTFTVATSGASTDVLMPTALRDAIAAFMAAAKVDMEYYPEGDVNSASLLYSGKGVLTDISLSAGTEGNIEFSLELTGDGALS